MLQWVATILGLITLLATVGLIFEWLKQKTRGPAPGELVDTGGRRLHLISAGEGEPVVIWEAGGGISSIATRSIQQEISSFSRICVYDRAGYGWSDSVAHPRSFDDLASDLELLLQTANIKPPYIVVGESMGGLIARRFVSRNPDSVSALLLLDSAEELHVKNQIHMLHKMQKGARVMALLARMGLIRGLLNLFPGKLGVPADVSENRKKALIDDVARATNFQASVNELEAYFSASHELGMKGGLGNVGDVPMIVVSHGKELTGSQAFLEQGWQEAQERLLELSSRSALVCAENSGHAISIDEPKLVVDLIQGLVEDPVGFVSSR